jgi:hypothetical protein
MDTSSNSFGMSPLMGKHVLVTYKCSQILRGLLAIHRYVIQVPLFKEQIHSLIQCCQSYPEAR